MRIKLAIFALAAGLLGGAAVPVLAARGGTPNTPVCHKGHTIRISPSAVPAHLRHGDTLGPCGAAGTPTQTPAQEATPTSTAEPTATDTPQPEATVTDTPEATATGTPKEPTATDTPVGEPTATETPVGILSTGGGHGRH